MSATPTDAEARQAQIVGLARDDGTVSVEELAQRFAVTPQTIRKDLALLERRGMLTRVHGGAVAQSGTDNLDYAERRMLAVAAKTAIGRAAAALVADGTSLFINIGTTTEAIASHLTDRRGLMVITNNLNVVAMLTGNPAIEVIAAGGRVRASDRAVIGAVAMDFIRGVHVDMALIGASAINGDGSFFDFDVDEVHVSQTIIRHARRVVLAVDATKIARAAPVRIGGLADIDYLVIDSADDALRDACAAAGVVIVEALPVSETSTG